MKTLEQKIFPYLLLAPTVVIFGVYLFYPALNGLWISMLKWDGVSDPKWIGFENYRQLFSDSAFWNSFIRTAVFTLLSVPLVYCAALGLAMLLTRSIRGTGFFRAVFYWPTMISTIIVGLAWRFLLGEDFGLLNYFITKLGATSVKWLTDPTNAMVSVIFVTVWSMAGYYMVMFIAGIQAISGEYYEAAQIDGASGWQQFVSITLPLLRPTSLLVLVLSTVSIIKTYPLVFALAQGGPAGATKFMVQMIQETGFDKGKLGYACAMATVLFVILAICALLQFKINEKGGESDV